MEALPTVVAREVTHSIVNGDAMIWSESKRAPIRPNLRELERIFGMPPEYLTGTPGATIAELMTMMGNMQDVRELVDIVQQSMEDDSSPQSATHTDHTPDEEEGDSQTPPPRRSDKPPEEAAR